MNKLFFALLLVCASSLKAMENANNATFQVGNGKQITYNAVLCRWVVQGFENIQLPHDGINHGIDNPHLSNVHHFNLDDNRLVMYLVGLQMNIRITCD